MKDLFDQLIMTADDLTEPTSRMVSVPDGWTKSRNRAKPTMHRVTTPSLLAQLYDAVIDPPTLKENIGAGRKPHSKPPLAVEAFSAYTVICQGALRWVKSIRLAPRDNVESNIRALVGAAPRFDLDTMEALHDELRQWHSRASVLTGSVNPPFQPRMTCPMCETRWSIWVNGERELAFCKECRCDWQGTAELMDLVRLATKVEAT